MERTLKMSVLLIQLLFLVGIGNTRTIRIPSDFPSIQEGIDNAVDGDTVLVSSGTYVEMIDFKGKAILLTSVAGTESTVIDGDNAGTVVSFVSGEDTTSVIRGFTIRNGLASYQGGGILCQASSPIIWNNLIVNNLTQAEFFPGASLGGGIFCGDASPLIKDNIIVCNLAISSDYEVLAEGGGIFITGSSSPEIKNNLIALNEAIYSWDNGAGGGIYFCSSAIPRITNNTIVGNVAGAQGGGIYCCIPWDTCAACSAQITNNILAGNSQGVFCYGFAPSILYNDLWDNGEGDFYGGPAGIGDTTWGVNTGGIPCDSFFNIFRDPDFAVGQEREYYLSQTAAGQVEQSPCVDAGSASAESLGFGCYTTRTDSVPDSGVVDMGFHYEAETCEFVRSIHQSLVPVNFYLSQNYPNPFNPITKIRYALPRDRWVRLEIYSILGKRVATLVDRKQRAGYEIVRWDGSSFSSGVYFCRIKAGDFVETKKMILLK